MGDIFTDMGAVFSIFGLAALAAGYLLGSIPFGLLLTRAAGMGDVRAIGSGNIGATNVLRTGNKKLAAATLLLDLLKGTAGVVLAGLLVRWWYVSGSPSSPGSAGLNLAIAPLAGGLGAFLGHLYPVWLRFKGGKGVATYIGVLLGLAPPVAALFCLVWLLTALVTRYSSLSALVASLVVPVYYLVAGLHGIGFIVIMSLLIFYKHRDNIRRLMAGEESKIGAKT